MSSASSKNKISFLLLDLVTGNRQAHPWVKRLIESVVLVHKSLTFCLNGFLLVLANHSIWFFNVLFQLFMNCLFQSLTFLLARVANTNICIFRGDLKNIFEFFKLIGLSDRAVFFSMLVLQHSILLVVGVSTPLPYTLNRWSICLIWYSKKNTFTASDFPLKYLLNIYECIKSWKLPDFLWTIFIWMKANTWFR